MEEWGDRRDLQEKEDGLAADPEEEGRSSAVLSLGGGGIRRMIFWALVLRFLRLIV